MRERGEVEHGRAGIGGAAEVGQPRQERDEQADPREDRPAEVRRPTTPPTSGLAGRGVPSGVERRSSSTIATQGIARIANGMNHQPTAQPGRMWRSWNPRAHRFSVAWCCQTSQTTIVASSTGHTTIPERS